eukprot:1320891-Rhodomonas_salina.2
MRDAALAYAPTPCYTICGTKLGYGTTGCVILSYGMVLQLYFALFLSVAAFVLLQVSQLQRSQIKCFPPPCQYSLYREHARSSYATCGTDLAVWRYAKSSTTLTYAPMPCYPKSDTNLAYGPTAARDRSAHAAAFSVPGHVPRNPRP